MAIEGVNVTPEELVLLQAASEGLTPQELQELNELGPMLAQNRDPAGGVFSDAISAGKSKIADWLGIKPEIKTVTKVIEKKAPAAKVVGSKPKSSPTPAPTPEVVPTPVPTLAPTTFTLPSGEQLPLELGGKDVKSITLSPYTFNKDYNVPKSETFIPIVDYVGNLPMPTMEGMAKGFAATDIQKRKLQEEPLPTDLTALANMVDYYSGTDTKKWYKPETKEQRQAKINELEKQAYDMRHGLSKQEMDLLETLLGYKFAGGGAGGPKVVYGDEFTKPQQVNMADKFRKEYRATVKDDEVAMNDMINMAQSSFTDPKGFVNKVFERGYGTRLARIMGEKGALSQKDVEPYKNLNPDAWTTMNRAYDKFIDGKSLQPADIKELKNYFMIMRDQMLQGQGRFKNAFLQMAQDYGISQEAAHRLTAMPSEHKPSPTPFAPKTPKGGGVKSGGPKSLKERIQERRKAKGL